MPREYRGNGIHRSDPISNDSVPGTRSVRDVKETAMWKVWALLLFSLTFSHCTSWSQRSVIRRCVIIWADFHNVYRKTRGTTETIYRSQSEHYKITAIAWNQRVRSLAIATSPETGTGEHAQIHLIDERTTAEKDRLVVTDEWVGELKFSPTGDAIAYLATQPNTGPSDARWILKLLDLSSGSDRQVYSGALSRIRWVGPGSTLYVTSYDQPQGRYAVLRIDPDGGVQETIPDTVSVAPGGPGGRLARIDSHGAGVISDPSQKENRLPLSRSELAAKWSPEIRFIPGTDILTMSRTYVVPYYELYLIAPPYRQATRLLNRIGIQDYVVYLE